MYSHVPTLRRWFGIDGASAPADAAPDPALPPPAPRTVWLITGPSGAGKTRLMRRLVRSIPSHHPPIVVIDAGAIDLPDRAVVDCFDSLPLPCRLRLLSRCGLAEAWTYLRRPGELSEGQRWRLRLAIALARAASARRHGGRAVLVIDEFAALLDRVSAAVIAHSLRRIVDASDHLAVVCATCHDDLTAALSPDLVIRCDFGRVHVRPLPPTRHP